MMSRVEARQRAEERDWRPRNCVWELTLACNLRCLHCGSSAGRIRRNELKTAECLDIVDQLAELGCELITLSGGEPTLRKDWDTIARATADRGLLVNMVTNGVYRSDAIADEIGRRALDAGMSNVGISIDGPEAVHDFVRGEGSFARSIRSVERFTALGLRVAVMTTVNRLNLPILDEVKKVAIEAGATMWRLQLAKPMGNLKLNRTLVIRPTDLLALIPTLVHLKRAGGIHVAVGDSIGYYGPHDRVLRGRGWRGRKESWQGCQAGMQAIGIEADGTVKGCLSLQAMAGDDDPFAEGNLRESRLEDIWYRPGIFAYNRDFEPESLTGGCRGCRNRAICRGGARCVASAFCGHLGEDPYCFYRLLTAQRRSRLGWLMPAAQSAAAALLISLGASGCLATDPVVGVEDAAVDTGPDRVDVQFDLPGFDAVRDAGADGSTEPDVQIEYGVPPDTGPADAVDAADVSDEEPVFYPEYGIEPDLWPDDPVDAADVSDEEPVFYPEYGIEPDVGQDADAADVATDPAEEPIDCSTVCCMCDYGVIPDPVWEACCEPDPCADVCCECDYGEPPPPECCD